MNTAKLLAKYLQHQECTLVFGMPGGASLPLLEAFRAQNIDFILVRQEASAGFMADGVFQRTGKLGVCLATLGPGLTNLVSGIAQAYTERSRILGITSQIDDTLYPIYTHQIIDQKAIFEAICHGYFQIHPHRPAEQIRKMSRKLNENLGPVMLEITKKAANYPCKDLGFVPATQKGIPDLSILKKALSQSQRPLIFAGAEDLSPAHQKALTAFATTNKIPVLTTYRGKGLCPESAPFSLGACGLSPVVDQYQQEFITQADLLICVGLDPVELRPNWLPGWPDDLKAISISEYGQPDLLCSFALELRGNIAQIMTLLGEFKIQTTWDAQKIKVHKETIEAIFEGDKKSPGTVFKTLQKGLPENTILCLDVGAHRITGSHVWKAEQTRMILQSNGFSSMGVGIPYGIACALLEPKTPVLVVTGDMGLMMSLGEFGIIQERKLNIIIVYLADHSLSLIELKQERDQLPNFGVRFENPNPESLAHAFDGKGWICQDALQLETLLTNKALLTGFHLVEVHIDPAGYRFQM
jgi:acetolactate synthase-1/2/3 large subunit